MPVHVACLFLQVPELVPPIKKKTADSGPLIQPPLVDLYALALVAADLVLPVGTGFRNGFHQAMFTGPAGCFA